MGKKVRKLLDEAFPNFVSQNPSGTRLVYELRSTEVERIKTSAINQALETLRNRIDQFGVANL